MPSKTEFRAIRELVGMTQATLAEALGVQERSVRRWESLEAPQEPPEDAWELLGDAEKRQEEGLALALNKVDGVRDVIGDGRLEVHIAYWASQSDYLEHSVDAKNGVAGDYRMANANARALCAILEAEGVEVVFQDGKENPALLS